ncbi:MAG: response regulator transcription factor [Phycisphaerae bacterium]|nr:response regulator transcription factor [Phycisphaerae bacterium]
MSDSHTARVCLIGGKRIIRQGISELLGKYDLPVATQYQTGEDFADSADSADSLEDVSRQPYDLIILLLEEGSYSNIHHIREVLGSKCGSVPLVIISAQIGRGQVYAALRIGAKAYLDLDCAPEELAKAVRMALANKVYLSPDVAELLVNDVSATFEPAKSSRLPSLELSRREVEIVQLLCEGLSSKEVARHLHLSAKTVENHRYNIYKKCEVDSIAALMRYAIQHGLISI